jgi:chromate transporter
MTTDTASTTSPTIATTFPDFARIGLLSFGGPAAQIALMHRVLVEERGYLTERQFLNALSFCMLLPGPEAMQLATYAGWRLHGTLGGLIAGGLFVVPGAIVMLALASVYAVFGNVPLIEALFLGVKAAVLVIVVEALMRVARKALSGKAAWIVAGLAFLALFAFALPYPLIVLMAGLFGFIGANATEEEVPQVNVSWRRTLGTALTWLSIWLVPVALLDLLFGTTILPDLARFFSTLAVVTFGGAYSVLAYMAQDVVTREGWLTAREMMDGLGLAETTPGPLILVTQFVGFLAAFKEGGFWFGAVGALVTVWVTFVPCFAWIFTGAPYIEWIGAQPRLSGALKAITAAVVGVILNLSIWFALHVLFAQVDRTEHGLLTLWVPQVETFDWRAGVLAILAAALLLGFKAGLTLTLLAAALGGLVLSTFA